MKRRLLFLLMALLLATVLAGCGNPVKNEQELMEDLNSISQDFMVEGSRVTELSIIKRLTDEENKRDTVYVSILIDHPNAIESQAYVMKYTLYNEGWILDDMEKYLRDDETVWKLSPKGPPSNERIMDQLIAYSNIQIDMEYANQWISEELTHTYFFEEGKYATKIYSGSFSYPTEYSCIVETDRVFNYAKVYEKQQLYFWFDECSYEWYLAHDEILSLDHGLQFYIDGTWQDPLSGALISFYESSSWGSGWGIEGVPYSEYYAECNINNEKYTQTFNMLCPSTRLIDSTLIGFGETIFTSIHINVEITPDTLWCYDWFSDQYYELVPIELDSYPPELDVTGVIDMTGNP